MECSRAFLATDTTVLDGSVVVGTHLCRSTSVHTQDVDKKYSGLEHLKVLMISRTATWSRPPGSRQQNNRHAKAETSRELSICDASAALGTSFSPISLSVTRIQGPSKPSFARSGLQIRDGGDQLPLFGMASSRQESHLHAKQTDSEIAF
jgi:hypothetical protein